MDCEHPAGVTTPITRHPNLVVIQARPAASTRRPAGGEGDKPMTSNTLTGKLANFSARRRWTVLGSWLVVLVAAFFLAGTIGEVTSNTGQTDTKMESSIAMNLIDERLNSDEPSPSKEYVLVEFETGTADNANNKAFVRSLTADLLALEDVIAVASYLDGGEGMLNSDQNTALVLATLSVEDSEAADIVEPLLAVIADADASSGYRVSTVGQGSVEVVFNALAEETLANGEMIGIGFALIVLLVVFGAAVAAGLPILLAIVSIIVAIALSAVIGRVMDLDPFVVQIITMIGLAVGIDYSLFIVKRFGEELARGRNKIEAITAAGSTAGRTVTVSGVAVMIALSGMLIVPSMTFRSFGLGAMVVVIAAVFAATTLLPAIISVLGHRVYWLRILFVGRKIVVGEEDSNRGGAWDKITNAVTGGGLLAVTVAAFTMNLGSSGLASLPEDNSVRHAFEVINAEFNDGLITADIVIDAPDVTAPAVQTAIESLKSDLAADPFFGDTKIKVAPENNLAVVFAVMQGDYASEEAEEAIARLRDQYIPAAFDGVADVYVAGDTDDRVLAPAVPLQHPVRPVDGLPRLPAQPDQGALRPDWR